jgi:hypothetical protein
MRPEYYVTNSGPALDAAEKKMRNAYIIEIDDEAVGIAARDRDGFRFHAALRAFNGLDGRLFPSLKEATRAARALLIAGRSAAMPGRDASSA